MAWNSLVRTVGSMAKIPFAPLVRQAALSGTGRALPARVLANRDFPASLGTSNEWILTRTGIRERRIAGQEDTSFTLGLEASRAALTSAGLSPRDLDLIVCATVTPETMVPSNACRIQGALGCRPIAAFDINGACTGFVQGLTIASQFIAAGTCEHVLVIGAELLSRTTNYLDRSSCILFGDGAGAVVLSATAEGDHGLVWSKLYSDGEKSNLITMPSHVTHSREPAIDGSELRPQYFDPFLALNGREVFKFAVRTMIALVREALCAVELARPDRLFLVPHQVNQRIIDAALEDLPIPAKRVVLNLERYGNTSAASIPIALDEALRAGVVGPGDHLLLVAFGGGMTWGGAMITL